MVIINYLGRKDSIDDVFMPEGISITNTPIFREHDLSYDQKYLRPNNDYDVIEIDFLGAGPGWEIRGLFVPGNSRPYVLRNLHGPEKYRTKKHELVHKDLYDEGIPQSESEVRRITSGITDFRDYYA